VDNPAVPLAKRQEIVRQLLASRITAQALRLVSLLVERGRVNALPKLSEDYNRLLNAHRGVVEATVTSAVPLTADETAEIRSRVEAMAGSAVELRSEVDPDLLGGLTIQVRDRLLDASIRGRLERLRDQLHAGTRPR
jgi:F-type H+-transporting ATPase subunit delta